MKILHIALSLVVGFLLLIPSGSPTSPLLPLAVSAQDSDDLAAIHGRLWEKFRAGTSKERESSAPVANGSVFVTDTDLTELYGETTTKGGAGPDAGSFKITHLPANQDLLVFYFDLSVPGYLQVEEIRLAPNEDRELAPNDPNALVTRLMTATDILGSLKELVKKDLELAHQAADTESAEVLKSHLDKLSLPPAPEEPIETGTEATSGGLSGKTIGVIGAAAGGAGFAVAAVTGGSDNASSSQPIETVTTTTTTMTTVSSTSTSWNCQLLMVRHAAGGGRRA